MLVLQMEIHKDEKSDYGVIVRGFWSTIFSSGRTLDEAINNAREAVQLHLQGVAEDEIGGGK